MLVKELILAVINGCLSCLDAARQAEPIVVLMLVRNKIVSLYLPDFSLRVWGPRVSPNLSGRSEEFFLKLFFP